MPEWYEVLNVETVPSPALLIYPDRVAENIRRMVALTGGPELLRPHVKTHKLPEIVRLQLDAGITRFKCATIAEAEMTAQTGARDVLLAFQPVGPNVRRLVELVNCYPGTHFSTIVDDQATLGALSRAFSRADAEIGIYLDLDVGMHRTGIAPGPAAVDLYQSISSQPAIRPEGLHAYDGHIHEADPDLRKSEWDEAMTLVWTLRQELLDAGLPVPHVVSGGSPTLALHAAAGNVECSAGTPLLWDFGYSDKFHDLDFLHAAVLLSRVVSKPGENRLCVDLGHKSVAAENPHPRVRFLNLPDAEFISHSEEHLVVESARAKDFKVGDCLYGIPRHVCPTVNLFSEVTVVHKGHASDHWRVAGRERKLTV